MHQLILASTVVLSGCLLLYHSDCELIREFLIVKMASNNPPRLRSTDLSCPLLGNSEDLKTNVLPTKEMLLKYYLHLKAESGVQKPKGLHYSVTESVLEIWRTSSIPTVSKPQVQKLVNKLLESYASLKKRLCAKRIQRFQIEI